jgi:hypothetical protein
MLLAYLVLTTVISVVIFVGTANRHDTNRFWKYAVLASLVWPFLLIRFIQLRIRRTLRERCRVRKISSTGETIKAQWSPDSISTLKAYHTIEAEEALAEVIGEEDE